MLAFIRHFSEDSYVISQKQLRTCRITLFIPCKYAPGWPEAQLSMCLVTVKDDVDGKTEIGDVHASRKSIT